MVNQQLNWRKSSRSNSGGQCVEVRSDGCAVRDSKNPAGHVLTVPNLVALIGEIKRGHFDL